MTSTLKLAGAALSFAFFSATALAQTAPKLPEDPGEYEFRANRVVRLSGEINRATAITVIQRLQYLDANNPDGKDITLLINSGGGDVEQGLAIYDTMRNLKSDVKTVCEGRAMSMAAVLLAAGAQGKRMSLPHCRIMLHQASAATSGKASDMVNQLGEITKMNEAMMDILSRHLDRDKADVTRAFQPDYFVNAIEAKMLGVIDSIQTPARASLPPGARPMPALPR